MKLNAFEFAQEVDWQIEQLSKEEYLLRQGRSKKLQEELLPISRLGIHFKLPGLSVEVEAFENDGSADGHISISGFRSEEFDVQITYIYDHEESLRKELLVSQGVAPGAGAIFRDRRNRKITSTISGINQERQIDDIAQAIIERFRKKISKVYATNTILLIAFDKVTLYGNKTWSKILTAIETKGGLNSSKFHQIFLLNCAYNDLVRAA